MSLRALLVGSLAVGSVFGACSSPEFTPSESSGGAPDRGGASSGGADPSAGGQGARGGTDPIAGDGGQGAEGGTGTPTGGLGGTSGRPGGSGGSEAGMSGSSTGGSGAVGGSAGSDTGRFPSFGVLDDFNREGPELGLDWVGGTTAYGVSEQTLVCPADYCSGVFWHEAFGPQQEVFATLVSFAPDSPEINLVLKAQGDTSCDLIELLYAPARGEVLVEGCWNGSWHSFGTIDVAFEPGDQLGGRARPDGFIDVFKNGVLAGSADANDYPYIELEGRIGVDGIVATDAPANVWDDFGGG